MHSWIFERWSRCACGLSLSLLALGCSNAETARWQERPAPVARTHELIVLPSAQEVQPFLVWGGRLQAVAVDPADPTVVIAAGDSGGLFRSVSSGSAFERLIFPSLDTNDIRFCPFDSSRVVLSVLPNTRVNDAPGAGASPANDGGIWLSIDSGSHWSRPSTHFPSGLSSYSANQIAFGESCNDVFVGTSAGLAISHNGGTDFTYDTINGLNPYVVSVITHPGAMPGNPIIDIYTYGAGTDPAGVRRSLTGGGTWTTPRPATGPVATALGIPSPMGGQAVHSLAVSATDGNVLFAASQNTKVDMGVRDLVPGEFQVYESDDGGDTWTSLDAVPGGQNRVPMVFATSSKSGTGTDVYWGNGTNIWWQTCANTSGLRCTPSTSDPPAPPGWQFINLIGIPSHPDPSDMAFDPVTHCPLYLATDGGLLKSTPLDLDDPTETCGNTGTWAITRGSGGSEGLNALQLFQVAGQTHTAESTDLYFGTMDNGIWGTIDSGSTWNNGPAEGQGIQLDHFNGDRSTTRVNTMDCAGCINAQSNAGLLGGDLWKNAPLGLADAIFHTPGQIPACPDRDASNSCDACVNRQLSGVCDPVGPGLADACSDLDNDGLCDGTNCVDAEPTAFCDPLFLTLTAGPTAIALAPGLVGGAEYVQWDGGYTQRGTLVEVAAQLYRTSNYGDDWTPVSGVTFPPAANPGYRLFDRPRVGVTSGGPVMYQPVCRASSGCASGDAVVGLIRVTNLMSGTPQLTDVDLPGGSLSYEGFDPHGSYGFDPLNANQLIAMDKINNTMRKGTGDSTGVVWTLAGADPGMNQLATLLTRNGEFAFNLIGTPQLQAIEFDPTNGQRIVVGTRSVGVAVSLDGGGKWSRLCKSEEIPRVRSFFFDEKNPINDLPAVYASSYGRGIWKLDLSQRQEPVFTVPPVSFTAPDCAVDIGSATAIDECQGVPVDVIAAEGVPPTDPAFGCSTNVRPCGNFPPNTTTPVTWTARDVYGDTTTVIQNVTVTDSTKPIFTVFPPDVTTTSCTGVNLGVAAATDGCGGSVTVSNNAPAKFPPGTTVVTYTATDARGNMRTATQRVTVSLGDDPACCPAGTTIILGNSNNNTLNGTSGSDCILGRGAQDTINGNGGNDFISGGEGNDIIAGGLGNDVIFAGTGQDNVNGNDGNDTLDGGDGDDIVLGGIGDDTLRGGQGQDSLQGQDGNDLIIGGTGDDNLQGGNGNDTLAGSSGNDTCNGGTGTNLFEQCEFGAPNSCADLVQNGTETALDCGGGCPRCEEGLSCQAGSDCQSNVCSSTCQGILGGLAVIPVIETDWGGGYCVRLQVTNVNATPTTTWTARLNTNQSTIYTSAKGNFSGSSGVIDVTPALPENTVIDPSEADTSITFCANRTVSGSGTLPFVVSASASY